MSKGKNKTHDDYVAPKAQEIDRGVEATKNVPRGFYKGGAQGTK